MSLKDIYKALGIEPTYANEVEKMNNRIKVFFDNIGRFNDSTTRTSLFREIILSEGLDIEQYLSLVSLIETPGKTSSVKRKESALQKNMLHLQCLIDAVDNIYQRKELLTKVENLFNKASFDIGYIYRDGIIVKSGAKALDNKLILENMVWLRNFPTCADRFNDAISDYLGKRYANAITNAYASFESMVKTILKTNSRFDKPETKADFLRWASLDKEWAQLLNNYCEIAHAFSSRHGKSEEKNGLSDVSAEQTEFFIYITGTFLRLISRKAKP